MLPLNQLITCFQSETMLCNLISFCMWPYIPIKLVDQIFETVVHFQFIFYSFRFNDALSAVTRRPYSVGDKKHTWHREPNINPIPP